MAARTLLQHALPTTFGQKAAGWMTGLDAASARLDEVGGRGWPLSSAARRARSPRWETNGPAVLAFLAEDLGLAEPAMPWHTERTRIADLAGALGSVAGAIGKAAGDVVLLAQTEVGEVREGVAGRGGSSTLPHKRNPIAAVLARAGADQAPGLVATLLASMAQEHERAAGAWHAEWRPLSALLLSTGSAAAWLRDCLEHLEVDVARMRANLDLTGGLLLAERVTTALTPDARTDGRARGRGAARPPRSPPAAPSPRRWSTAPRSRSTCRPSRSRNCSTRPAIWGARTRSSTGRSPRTRARGERRRRDDGRRGARRRGRPGRRARPSSCRTRSARRSTCGIRRCAALPSASA